MIIKYLTYKKINKRYKLSPSANNLPNVVLTWIETILVLKSWIENTSWLTSLDFSVEMQTI